MNDPNDYYINSIKLLLIIALAHTCRSDPIAYIHAIFLITCSLAQTCMYAHVLERARARVSIRRRVLSIVVHLLSKCTCKSLLYRCSCEACCQRFLPIRFSLPLLHSPFYFSQRFCGIVFTYQLFELNVNRNWTVHQRFISQYLC